MKNSLFAAFCFLVVGSVSAQRHEIGIRLGGNNLVGDVGSQSIGQFINPIPRDAAILLSHIGILYRKNLNPNQSLRLDVAYNEFYFKDSDSKEAARRARKYYGQNYMLEANVLFEYYFRAINQETEFAWSPYIFGGLGAFMFNGKNYSAGPVQQSSVSGGAEGNLLATAISIDPKRITYTRQYSASVPFGIGFKQKFNYNWTLSLEAMFRPTYTDKLDFSEVRFIGEVPEAVQQRLLFGNPNSIDWVNTLSLTLAYTFGRLPCSPD